MGKISTDKLHGSRQRDNSVNSTSTAADTAASNPSQTQSNADNGNVSELYNMDKVNLQSENELLQGQTPSERTSSYEIKGAGDPVNMATGEYIYEDKDFILTDMGGEYSLT